MKTQEKLNAISTLSASVDPMIRAGNYQAANKVIDKILELVDKL